jgi:predicted RNA-binding Zn-ribbon protein involved in translation (DUF1610 family)
MGIIIGGFVGLFVVLPGVIFFVRRYPMICEMQEVLDKPFVCPNCGHPFKIKMHQVWYRLPSFYVAKGFKAKCPKCRQTDICSRTHLE